MGLIAKNESAGGYQALEAGVYQAVCSGVIDLGIQHSDLYDNDSKKVLIMWDIVGVYIGNDDNKQLQKITKDYTNSLNEKATLRKHLEAWRNKQFTQEELDGFDLRNILNCNCQIQINQTEKNGRTYSNIAAIMAMPKGQEQIKAEKIIEFDLDDFNATIFETLPNWIQEKIKNSKTYKTIFDGGTHVSDEDLPDFVKDEA